MSSTSSPPGQLITKADTGVDDSNNAKRTAEVESRVLTEYRKVGNSYHTPALYSEIFRVKQDGHVIAMPYSCHCSFGLTHCGYLGRFKSVETVESV